MCSITIDLMNVTDIPNVSLGASVEGMSFEYGIGWKNLPLDIYTPCSLPDVRISWSI